nr:hypothetical protein [uncultured Dongia sp.]
MAYMDHSNRSEKFGNAESFGTVRHLNFTDVILLAGLALGGYLASAYFDDGSSPAAGLQQRSVKQAVCSDEELRQMRSGPETCYDAPGPRGQKSETTAPSGAPSGALNNT